MRSSLIAFSVAAATAACWSDPPPPPAGPRDSAGVRIIRSDAPAWKAGSGWRIEPTPAVSIGAADGDPAYLLSDVQDALRLEDGRIVVLDTRAGQLRVYSAAGRHVADWGRSGRGPGEFVRPITLARYGSDSLVVFDGAAARATVLGTDGSVGTMLPIPFHRSGAGETQLSDIPRVVGALPGGAFVVHTPEVIDLDAKQWPRRALTTFTLVYTDGTVPDTIGRFEGTRVLGRHAGASGTRTENMSARVVSRLHRDRLYVAGLESFEVREYAVRDGTLLRIFRSWRDPVPVTEQMKRTRAERIGRSGEMTDQAPAERVRRELQMPHAAVLQPTAELLVDPGRNVWMILARPPGSAGPASRALVFDSSGVELGIVNLPPGLRVLDVGDAWVLGTMRDAAGVPLVRYHILRKDRP